MAVSDAVHELLKRIGLEKTRDKFKRDIVLSGEAKALIENPLIDGFFREYERQLIKAWRESQPGPDGQEARDAAYQMLGILDEFMARLRRFVAAGDSAKAQLEALVDDPGEELLHERL